MAFGREGCGSELMPIDWNEVVSRYGDGAEISAIPGVSQVKISGADEERIYVKHKLWKDSLSRQNLERAVMLLEQNKMTKKSGDFVAQYRVYVADERPTMAATVLKDLGYLE